MAHPLFYALERGKMSDKKLEAMALAMGKEVEENTGEGHSIIEEDLKEITPEVMAFFDNNYLSVVGTDHEKLHKFSWDIFHNPRFAHAMMHIDPLTLHMATFCNGFLFACFIVSKQQEGVDVGEMDADLMAQELQEFLDELPDFESEEAQQAVASDERDQEPPDDSDLDM